MAFLSSFLSRKGEPPVSTRPDASSSDRVGISIFGDSHATRFAVSGQMQACEPLLKRFDVNLKSFSGGTITGFGKRASTLGLAEKIEEALRPSDAAVVFAFGQVDVELGYFYRRVVKGLDLDFAAFAEELVEGYMAFIGRYADRHRVYVKGINPSVLAFFRRKAINYTSRIITENVTEPAEKARALEALKRVYPAPAEAARNHALFNHLLACAAARAGHVYFDLSGYLSDPATGLIRPEFAPEAFDHHVPATLAVHMAHWRPLLPMLAAIDRRATVAATT